MSNILGTEVCECDLTGVHVKEYSTPTASRYQPTTLSSRTVTHVLAAPDFTRSADSIGDSAAVGFFRTLEGAN